MDEEEAPSARDRFDLPRDKTGKDHFVRQDRMGPVRCHSVLMDEVSLISPDLILDAIEVCKEYHVQLIIAGEFDREKFFQLGPVHRQSRTFFDVLVESEI